jgi:hypothetical protein
MGEVQERLSAEGNGREKQIEGRDQASGRAGEIEIVMRLIDRLSRDTDATSEKVRGSPRPYQDSELDLSGLDVPERED